MLNRIYIHNFQCVENFELDLNNLNLFIGHSGTGKASVVNESENITFQNQT
ncbi:MAG: AAA family ATPase [Desulfobacteraceae bacterium]|nr:AAA family ATPase [Desulfobacteraceae bacterium]